MHDKEKPTRGRRDFLTILFKHRSRMAGIFLATVLIAAVVSFLIPPAYEARSILMVTIGREYIHGRGGQLGDPDPVEPGVDRKGPRHPEGRDRLPGPGDIPSLHDDPPPGGRPRLREESHRGGGQEIQRHRGGLPAQGPAGGRPGREPPGRRLQGEAPPGLRRSPVVLPRKSSSPRTKRNSRNRKTGWRPSSGRTGSSPRKSRGACS